jgi:hypothetical protein
VFDWGWVSAVVSGESGFRVEFLSVRDRCVPSSAFLTGV